MAKICLNMIVKNESQIITRCLESVASVIDYYIICDTGSTDDTINIITSFFDARGISGEIHPIEFRNFEYSRNRALLLAQNSAVDFDYILLTDADMELVVVKPDFKTDLSEDCYLMVQQDAFISYHNVRMLRKTANAYYVGVTHEYIHFEGHRGTLESIYFIDHACGANRVEKYERDARLLEEGLRAEPENSRYRFYLAQTYYDIQQYETARENYRKRIDMGGWEEEVYYSYYRIGMIEKKLNRSETEILQAFLDCFNFRPQRAEPLHELAQYYRNNQKHALGYLFAKAGLDVPYPTSDILFIAQNVYTYKLLDELGVCAYWIGRYQESYDACRKLLDSGVLPQSEVERVQENLQYAEDQLVKA